MSCKTHSGERLERAFEPQGAHSAAAGGVRYRPRGRTRSHPRRQPAARHSCPPRTAPGGSCPSFPPDGSRRFRRSPARGVAEAAAPSGTGAGRRPIGCRADREERDGRAAGPPLPQVQVVHQLRHHSHHLPGSPSPPLPRGREGHTTRGRRCPGAPPSVALSLLLRRPQSPRGGSGFASQPLTCPRSPPPRRRPRRPAPPRRGPPGQRAGPAPSRGAARPRPPRPPAPEGQQRSAPPLRGARSRAAERLLGPCGTEGALAAIPPHLCERKSAGPPAASGSAWCRPVPPGCPFPSDPLSSGQRRGHRGRGRRTGIGLCGQPCDRDTGEPAGSLLSSEGDAAPP